MFAWWKAIIKTWSIGLSYLVQWMFFMVWCRGALMWGGDTCGCFSGEFETFRVDEIVELTHSCLCAAAADTCADHAPPILTGRGLTRASANQNTPAVCGVEYWSSAYYRLHTAQCVSVSFAVQAWFSHSIKDKKLFSSQFCLFFSLSPNCVL